MTDKTLAIIAIVAAVGLLGLVVAETISVQQQAEARGCKNSIAVNASKGRCFNP